MGRADAAFVVAVVAAIAVRAAAAAKSGAPPGFDGGDWLALGRGIFGRNIRPPGTVATPVVPVLSFLMSTAFGVRPAFVALQAVCAVAPGIGIYAVLRTRTAPAVAAGLAALVVASAAVGEAAAWGGYPQLLALGLIPLVVAKVDEAVRHGERRSIVTAGALLTLLALTSDFVFVYGLFACSVVVGFALATGRVRERFQRAVLVALPLLVVAPLYLQLVSARVGAVTDPAAAVGAAPRPSVVSRVDALWTDAPLLWRAIVLLGLISLIVSFSRWRQQLWRVAVALVAPALLGLAFWDEPRLAYFLPGGLVLALALWPDELAPGAPRRAGTLVLAVALAVQWFVLPNAAREQTTRYRALTPQLVKAIDWVGTNTKVDDLIVVTPFRDAPPVGWWLEGIARRRTLLATSEEWVFFEQERRDAREAARILSAGVPTPTMLSVARNAGADFVFIDKRWPQYGSARVESLREQLPGAVAYENGAAVILRVRQS